MEHSNLITVLYLPFTNSNFDIRLIQEYDYITSSNISSALPDCTASGLIITTDTSLTGSVDIEK